MARGHEKRLLWDNSMTGRELLAKLLALPQGQLDVRVCRQDHEWGAVPLKGNISVEREYVGAGLETIKERVLVIK